MTAKYSQLFVQLTAALSYALTSVAILIFNKIILSSYTFNYPVMMTLFHMLVCLLCLSLLKRVGLLQFSSFDRQLAFKALPLSICFVANIVVSMCALRMVNIPMFTTLRRLTVLCVIFNEALMLHKRPTMLISLSVFIMILGSLIGGWGDLAYDPVGYLLVLLNNAITAAYLVLIKRTIGDTCLKDDSHGIMYYNSLLAVPCLLIVALLNGEIWTIAQFPHLTSPYFQCAFVISALLSFAVNYTIFWCTKVNSALTTSVTGQVKNVLTSLVSMLAFTMHTTPMLLTGLCVGLCGSALYATAVYRNKKPVGKDSVSGNKANSANSASRHSPLVMPSNKELSHHLQSLPSRSPVKSTVINVSDERVPLMSHDVLSNRSPGQRNMSTPKALTQFNLNWTQTQSQEDDRTSHKST